MQMIPASRTGFPDKGGYTFPIVAAVIIGVSIAIFLVQSIDRSIVIHLFLNPAAIHANLGMSYTLLSYSVTNSNLFQLVLNCFYLAVPAVIVESKVPWHVTFLAVLVAAVCGGISFVAYSILTRTQAPYLGSAVVAVAYIGMLFVCGLQEWFLRNWTVFRKTIYFVMCGLWIVQLASSAISFDGRAIVLITGFAVGCVAGLLTPSRMRR